MFTSHHKRTDRRPETGQRLEIIANAVLFLTTEVSNSEATFAMIAAGYGIVPAELTEGIVLPGYHPVPEPATYAMLLGGLGLIAVLRRRKAQPAARR